MSQSLLSAFPHFPHPTQNAITAFSPFAIKGFILGPSELRQLVSQPVQPRLTERTCLPSFKQITSPKVLAQPLDLPIPRNRHCLSSVAAHPAKDPLCLWKHPLIPSDTQTAVSSRSHSVSQASEAHALASSLPRAAFRSRSTCRCTAGRTIKSKDASNVVADEGRSMILQCTLANRLVFEREILAQHGQRA
jgi:hypothetical protein